MTIPTNGSNRSDPNYRMKSGIFADGHLTPVSSAPRLVTGAPSPQKNADIISEFMVHLLFVSLVFLPCPLTSLLI